MHFDTPHIIFPFNFTALRGNVRLFLPLPATPPRLTLSPYLPVIMWCRWEGAVAEQVALYHPIPPFFFVCLVFFVHLFNKSELQQHKGTGEKKCGMRRQRRARKGQTISFSEPNFSSVSCRLRLQKEVSQLLIIWIPPSPGSTRTLKLVQLHWNV